MELGNERRTGKRRIIITQIMVFEDNKNLHRICKKQYNRIDVQFALIDTVCKHHDNLATLYRLAPT